MNTLTETTANDDATRRHLARRLRGIARAAVGAVSTAAVAAAAPAGVTASVVAVACLTASAARAQEPTPADKATARDLMDKGYEQLNRGELEAALTSFRGADAIMHVSSTGLAVGLALEKLGRLIEAREALLEVGRSAPVPGEAATMLQAREKAEKLQLELAERIPSLELKLTGLAPAAAVTVTVDGAVVPHGTLALPRKVNPGKHTVRGSAAGYKPAGVDVAVAERETKKLELAFVADEAGPRTTPDGAPPAISTFMWIGGGIATAGLVAGGVTGGLALSAASDAKAGCVDNRCPPSNEADKDRSLMFAHTSTATFALAGVGAGLFAYGLLFESPLLGADGVTPMFGLGTIGVTGSF